MKIIYLLMCGAYDYLHRCHYFRSQNDVQKYIKIAVRITVKICNLFHQECFVEAITDKKANELLLG